MFFRSDLWSILLWCILVYSIVHLDTFPSLCCRWILTYPWLSETDRKFHFPQSWLNLVRSLSILFCVKKEPIQEQKNAFPLRKVSHGLQDCSCLTQSLHATLCDMDPHRLWWAFYEIAANNVRQYETSLVCTRSVNLHQKNKYENSGWKQTKSHKQELELRSYLVAATTTCNWWWLSLNLPHHHQKQRLQFWDGPLRIPGVGGGWCQLMNRLIKTGGCLNIDRATERESLGFFKEST